MGERRLCTAYGFSVGSLKTRETKRRCELAFATHGATALGGVQLACFARLLGWRGEHFSRIIDVTVPAAASIASSSELWRALQHLGPSVFAFVLSFAIIFITWVNHHATMTLVNATSAPFIHANGFLLLTVVAIPFTAGVLGSFLFTDHAAPAVVLYDAVLAGLAIGWILLTSAALMNGLTTDERSASTMRESRREGYFACALYSLLTVTAFWLPLAAAIVTTVSSWIFWLARSIRMRHA